jgi:hypothetical protein
VRADEDGEMRNNPPDLTRTRIRATCPTCAEVELRGTDVALKVCTQPERSFYSFTCPACVMTVVKPADERVIRLLVSGGLTPDYWEPPAELLERHDGPVVGYDDLLDLHLLLESGQFWARLEAAGSGPGPTR